MIKKSYPDYHIENKTYFIVKKNYFWNKIDKYRLYSREYNKLGEKVCNIEMSKRGFQYYIFNGFNNLNMSVAPRGSWKLPAAPRGSEELPF